MTDTTKILESLPAEVLELRRTNQLHKLAEARTGTTDFGIDTAVGFIAKKASYRRHVNKAIAASINAVDSLQR